MSGAFDPYHRWLGIPSKDQPANHYRILGIELFEGDPEVIRDAAERQMAHVRTYQLGAYVQLSQRILNELAAAKACLLDPAKKAAYDAALKRPPQPKAKAVSPDDVYALAPTSPPVRLPEPSRQSKLASFLDEIDKPPPLKKPRVSRGSRLWQVGGVAAALALLAGLLFSGNRLWNSTAKLGQQTTSQCPDPSSPPSPAVLERHLAQALNVPPTRTPKLAKIPDQTVDKGQAIQFQVPVSNRGASRTLRFGLAAGAPACAKIDPVNGTFAWMPRGQQVPGDYPVTVWVRVDGSENLTDQTTFSVIVRMVARPPVIDPIGQRVVVAGRKIQFAVGAKNPGGSLDDVVFSLPEGPAWVSIDPATGVVTCEPDETESLGQYPVTVRAANKTVEQLQDEKTFTVVVNAANMRVAPRKSTPAVTPGNMIAVPPGTEIGRSYQKPGFAYSATRTLPFEIKLPSGAVLASVDVEVRDRVSREINTLLQKCHANSADAIGFYQGGPKSAVAAFASVKGNKLHGPTVIFHSCTSHDSPKPKQYVTYRDGRWEGVLATWNAQGQKEFWCNYASGQRHGMCCLFNDDELTAVLECTRNKIEAVHLITANQLNKSFTDADEALVDEAAGPLLKQVEKIEKDLKESDRAFRDRVKKGIQMKIGAINRQKREAFDARSAGRAAEQQQTFQTLRKAGGL